MSIAQRERAGLVEILRAVGPDAPTLCEGWTTRDLTAHLTKWEDLVDLFASGPPVLSLRKA